MRKIIPLILPLVWLITACELSSPQVSYVQRLVVFGNLNAGLPMVDTLFVSRSSSIEENIEADSLYIAAAVVTISDGDTTLPVPPVPGRPGRYLADPGFIFQPGVSYRLQVVWQGDTVTAVTTTPEKMEFSSTASDAYVCDGVPIHLDSINVHNVSLQNVNGTFLPLPSGRIDTVVYRTAGCFTESFASIPYFLLNFNAEDYNTVRILSLALEADTKGLEPYEDLNGNGSWEEGAEPFVDYNRNGVRDSTYINLIYDTTFTSKAWKGEYLRDEQNNPYRYNPFVWAVDSSPIPLTWLFFNYYGLHLMVLQATDGAYTEYFSGDPSGTNQYLLPDSNIEGGYGLFSSTYSSFFYVYIKPED
ncbi:MAG: DUF4249 family protein [Candidatus Neomarinimicrobiota bacterium]|nr:MAG: DUF4249 family protein [Candidatus Neomarinimicrobiota bacterium]